MVFSNQHIPFFLDRHREIVLAVCTQGGVMLISCALTSDYIHAQLLYCFAHAHTQNTTFFLLKHAAFLLFCTSCYSQSFNPESFSVFMATVSKRASVVVPIRACCCASHTDSPLSVLMTALHLSITPFLCQGSARAPKLGLA